jgi:hypothetical protein
MKCEQLWSENGLKVKNLQKPKKGILEESSFFLLIPFLLSRKLAHAWKEKD